MVEQMRVLRRLRDVIVGHLRFNLWWQPDCRAVDYGYSVEPPTVSKSNSNHPVAHTGVWLAEQNGSPAVAQPHPRSSASDADGS
jgi:hypothetical protein